MELQEFPVFFPKTGIIAETGLLQTATTAIFKLLFLLVILAIPLARKAPDIPRLCAVPCISE